MSSENELIKLYSERILALATELSAAARLDAPDGSIKKRSPLCGSAVTVDVKMKDGKISEFAQEVKACALGQAAASIVEKSAIGCNISEIQTARDSLHDMLKAGAPAPKGAFEGLEVLMPAKDFKNRHASIMLSIDATLEAMKKAESNVNCA